ncbi:MAG: 2-dehydropantoate 2-reductase [Candidatus Electrothrix sp. Rat3]|nr:2-dehydropantoate 2-reductase [Candidatus Electrothrix rattekaaiensis]
MKITIIGAGAMGCLFGGLLCEQGMDVHLIDVREEQVAVLNEHGLTILHQGVERVVRVRAVTELAVIPTRTDLVVIFVKHAQTEAAARTAARLLGSNGYALTLQNGMGNAEIIADVLGKERVLCGTTAQGAMVLGLGKIQHSGIGETVIGMLRPGRGDIATEVTEAFTAAGISCRAVDDIEPVLWKKLFVNVGINAVTALTGLRNGQLLEREATRRLMRDIVSEAIAVAEAYFVEVPSNTQEHVEQVVKATASNRSSMGQDIDGRRPTEIDAINGYIVRKAREVGLAVPVNQTLVRLVQTVQGRHITS